MESEEDAYGDYYEDGDDYSEGNRNDSPQQKRKGKKNKKKTKRTGVSMFFDEAVEDDNEEDNIDDAEIDNATQQRLLN